MRILTMTLLMIFSASCNSVQRKLICRQVESATFTVKPMYDVSFRFNRCRARCFDMTNWNAVAIDYCPTLLEDAETYGVGFDGDSESINLPVDRCEGVAGFSLEDIAKDIKPKILKLAAIKEDQCD